MFSDNSLGPQPPLDEDEQKEIWFEKNRPITPHKGGRTERLGVRITPADLAKLGTICEAQGISRADWIAKKINE